MHFMWISVSLGTGSAFEQKILYFLLPSFFSKFNIDKRKNDNTYDMQRMDPMLSFLDEDAEPPLGVIGGGFLVGPGVGE